MAVNGPFIRASLAQVVTAGKMDERLGNDGLLGMMHAASLCANADAVVEFHGRYPSGAMVDAAAVNDDLILF